jgi:hypothetical protein
LQGIGTSILKAKISDVSLPKIGAALSKRHLTMAKITIFMCEMTFFGQM